MMHALRLYWCRYEVDAMHAFARLLAVCVCEMPCDAWTAYACANLLAVCLCETPCDAWPAVHARIAEYVSWYVLRWSDDSFSHTAHVRFTCNLESSCLQIALHSAFVRRLFLLLVHNASPAICAHPFTGINVRSVFNRLKTTCAYLFASSKHYMCLNFPIARTLLFHDLYNQVDTLFAHFHNQVDTPFAHPHIEVDTSFAYFHNRSGHSFCKAFITDWTLLLHNLHDLVDISFARQLLTGHFFCTTLFLSGHSWQLSWLTGGSSGTFSNLIMTSNYLMMTLRDNYMRFTFLMIEIPLCLNFPSRLDIACA